MHIPQYNDSRRNKTTSTPQFDRHSTAYTPPRFPIDDPAPGNRRRHRPPTRRREPRGLPKREMILGGAPKATEVSQTPAATSPIIDCASSDVAELITMCHMLLRENDFMVNDRPVYMVPAVALEAIGNRKLTTRQTRRISQIVDQTWADPDKNPVAQAIVTILQILRVRERRVEIVLKRADALISGKHTRTHDSPAALRV